MKYFQSERFELTEDHLKLLERANVRWEDCETGAPAIDCERPYGNSYVAGDVAEILGWPAFPDDDAHGEMYERAMRLHAETETALEIVLMTRSFVVGTYVHGEYPNHHWRLKSHTLSATSTEGEGSDER